MVKCPIGVEIMKNEEIAISVIIPVYNLENYIKDCINSLLNQSLKNFELILVDDCSDDSTKKIIKEYIDVEKTADIILIENEQNMGAGYSRNMGLDIARGKYLIFLDGDDIFEFNMLEKIYHVSEAARADIAIFNFYCFNNENYKNVKYSDPIDLLIKSSSESFQLSQIGDCAFQYVREIAWNKIFRRQFIVNEGIRFQCQNNANDQFFVYAGLINAKKIVKIPDYLLRYRTNRKNQLSAGSSISKYPLCIWNALKATLDYIIKVELFDLYKESFNIYSVQRLLFSLKKVGVKERKKLLNYYKERGFNALKLLNCNFQDFGIPYFYAVYKRLINLESPEGLEEIENWGMWNNKARCEQLFEELIKENNMILWGAGKNGEIFLEKANDNRLDIKCIVDMDENKVGQVLQGHVIKYHDNIENNNLIIATNPDHILAIKHQIIQQKKKVNIFDLRAYLCFNIAYAQAKFEVS